MLRYLGHRLLHLLPTLALVSLLTFLALRVLPGDAAILMVAGGGPSEASTSVAQEELGQLRASLGLDAPWPLQYGRWLGDVLTLDMGRSLVSGREVWGDVARKLPVTVELAALATLVALLVGLPAGLFSALRQDTWGDYVVRVLALGGISLPHFWLATLVLLAGLFFFAWIPPVEYVGLFQDPLANLSQLLWPALVLGYSGGAIVARMTRSSLLEVLRQDYIRTARAKGLPEAAVVRRHALSNALLPVVTVVGLLLATLVTGAIIMEQVFALPGLGLYLLDGVRQRDYVVVQSVVLLFTLAVLLINLTVDAAYAWLDPRIRVG